MSSDEREQRARISGPPDKSVEALALAALESLPEASALVFDTELRYVIVRGPALSRSGFGSPDAEGRPVVDVVSPERWAFFEPLFQAALQGETQAVETPSTDGEHWYLVQVGPLRAGEGEVVGGVAFTTDITTRKRREDRNTSLFEFAPDAIAVVDADGQIVRVNAQAERLFGYEREELLGAPVETLVPKLPRDILAGHRSVYSADQHTRAMDVERELYGRRKDGGEFPVDVALSPLETDEGVFVSAAIRDVTERKRAEVDAAHFAAVVASSHDAIISKDLEGIVTSWNHGAERLYGYTEAEMLGSSVSVLLPPGHQDELPDILRRVSLGERIDEYDTVRVRKDDTEVDVALIVSPIRSADGTVIGASTITRDITARVRYQSQLRFLTEHDHLTGVNNRRRFERDLSESVGRARRYHEQSALIIIDMDAFKQINDTHGHEAGDRALKQVVSVIRRRLRDTDPIARIGGDEFAVLLPYAGESQVATVVEAIRYAIRDERLDLGEGTSIPLSASAGSALIDADSPSEDSVFAVADRSLYRDKERGGDSKEPAGKPQPAG